MSRLVTVILLVPLLFILSLMTGYFAAPAAASPHGRSAELAELLEDSVRELLRQAPLPTGSTIARHRAVVPG